MMECSLLTYLPPIYPYFYSILAMYPLLSLFILVDD